MSREIPRHGRVILEAYTPPLMSEIKADLREKGIPDKEIDERAREEFNFAEAMGHATGIEEPIPTPRATSRPITPRIWSHKTYRREFTRPDKRSTY